MNKQIPPLTKYGHLPPGIHTATIFDIEECFGRNGSKKRQRLTDNLRMFFSFSRMYAKTLYIDGSYVTKKLSPSDIDMIAIFPFEFMDDKNIAAHARLEGIRQDETLDLHIFPYIEGMHDEQIKNLLKTFTHTRPDNGKREKGIIRLECK